MLTFTTCWACDEPLAISYVGQLSHPGCPQHEDERLAREFCDAVQQENFEEAERLEKLLNAPKPEPKLGPSALWYAKHARWPVFPLKPGEKTPATRNGFKDASRDQSQIRQWWTENPMYNIGIPTGADTGFDVLDVDGEDGMRSLASLEAGTIPDVHGKVLTPRGIHLYLMGTNDGNRAGIRPGLDYRSSGGFAVAVPSIVGGRRYSWAVKPSPQIYGKD